MSKRAVILAGGKGTRLLPYTVVLPKPLMPIGEFPILEVIIRQLAGAGFDHITLAVNHHAEIIRAFFQDGGKWGIVIDYSLEGEPLGTIGPLRLIDDLPEHFLVMNGDVLTDLDFANLFRQHVEDGAIFTISSTQREHVVDFGVLETAHGGILTGFQEKPRSNFEVSMGIYVVSRAILRLIPPRKTYGFDNLMLDLIAAGKTVRVRRYEGYWLDIGRPEDYKLAIGVFEKSPDQFIR